MLRQAAERTGDVVGDGTSTSTILAHAIFADGVRNVVAGASAIDIKRGLDRGARGRRRGPARAVAAGEDRSGEGAGRRDLGPQRSRDRRARRRRDGEGRRRGRDHRRGVEDHGNARWRSSRACSSTAATSRPTSSPTPEDGGRARRSARAALRPQDRRSEGPASRAGAGREVGPAAAGRRRGRRGRGAGHAGRQQLRGRSQGASPSRRPGFGDRRKAMLQDIAILTGGQVISEELGFKLENVDARSSLGGPKRVVVDKDNTTIIGGGGDKQRDRGPHAADPPGDREDDQRLRPREAARSGWPSCPAALRSSASARRPRPR